jgi:uncharacterized membrane protein
MAKDREANRGFRKGLREEIKAWLAEGLVSEDQARALDERYALSALEGEGAGLLIATIYVIGAVLIGGGVISFVAAHWESIPTAAKVVMLFAAMLAAHVGGYVLWRVQGSRPRLGHALVVLGTLIFGANIGLMAQIFHIKSHFYNGFAAWTVGAALLAYCLWSVPNAVIAVVVSFIWWCGWSGDHWTSFSGYPLLLAAVGLPFAYIKRSGLVFFLVLVGVGLTVHIDVGAVTGSTRAVALAGIGLAVLLSGYGAFHMVVRPRREVGATALVLGGLSLAIWAYFLSFREAAHELDPLRLGEGLLDSWLAVGMIWAVLFGGAALWVVAGRRALGSAALRPYAIAMWAACMLMSVVVAALGEGIATVVLSNAALLALGAGLIGSGVTSLRRAPFWLGVALVGLLIVSRFLEYDTGLMLKAVAFLASGAGVIYGGIKFENLLRARRAIHE